MVTYHLLYFAAFPVAFWCCHLEPAEFVFASLSEFPAPAEKGKREGKGTHVNEMNGKSLIIKVKVVQSIPAVECMYTMGWNPFWRSILKVFYFHATPGPPRLARPPRPGPCLDFGFQYALIRNNRSKKFWVEHRALPGSDLPWLPWILFPCFD